MSERGGCLVALNECMGGGGGEEERVHRERDRRGGGVHRVHERVCVCDRECILCTSECMCMREWVHRVQE